MECDWRRDEWISGHTGAVSQVCKSCVDLGDTFHVCRPAVTRVMFNMPVTHWTRCMVMCPKYRRAALPSFQSQEELQELMAWARGATVDPVTQQYLPECRGGMFWLPFR